MRHVNKTNIYRALRKSYDDKGYHEVNDEWMAGFDCFGRAVLWSLNDDTYFRTGTILGCTSMSDLLRYATGLLLEAFIGIPMHRTYV